MNCSNTLKKLKKVEPFKNNLVSNLCTIYCTFECKLITWKPMSAINNCLMTRKCSQDLSRLHHKCWSINKKRNMEESINKQRKETERGKRRNLGTENNDGVLGTKGDQIRSTPWNVVHYSVATSSYKQSLYLCFTVVNIHYFINEKRRKNRKEKRKEMRRV